MKLLNSPELLKALRTKYRVPQPPIARRPLIRVLRAQVGIPIYHFKRRGSGIDVGLAPAKMFSQGGALYAHINDSKKTNNLLHELCHAVVAQKKGKLQEPNYGLHSSREDADEIRTCNIEFYVGFMSGFYSWQDLGEFVIDYSFTGELVNRFDEGSYSSERSDPWSLSKGLDNYTVKSVIRFMRKCRKVTSKYPKAMKALKKAGGDTSIKALERKIRAHAA